MKNIRYLLLLVSFVVIAGATESTPIQFYRAYDAGKQSPAVQDRLRQLEKRFDIVAAPGSITAPEWITRPDPFTFEMRRAHAGLWIEVFLLIDAKGAVRRCTVLSATDELVAREAGRTLAEARYKPGLMDGRPVACAAIVGVEGSGR